MKDKTYNNADSFAISFDDEWEKVVEQQNILDSNLERELSHIKNYKELIKTRDTDMFTKSRIEYITTQYSNIIRFIKQTCPELPSNLN